MNNGKKAKIIYYNGFNDIIVEFEDGTVVRDRTYSAFKKGEIKNPNYNPNNKLGEECLMKNGLKAKIVVYRSTRDIDIEFEDSTVVEHKRYRDFKKGEIKNPHLVKGGHIGSLG